MAFAWAESPKGRRIDIEELVMRDPKKDKILRSFLRVKQTEGQGPYSLFLVPDLVTDIGFPKAARIVELEQYFPGFELPDYEPGCRILPNNDQIMRISRVFGRNPYTEVRIEDPPADLILQFSTLPVSIVGEPTGPYQYTFERCFPELRGGYAVQPISSDLTPLVTHTPYPADFFTKFELYQKSLLELVNSFKDTKIDPAKAAIRKALDTIFDGARAAVIRYELEKQVVGDYIIKCVRDPTMAMGLTRFSTNVKLEADDDVVKITPPRTGEAYVLQWMAKVRDVS